MPSVLHGTEAVNEMIVEQSVKLDKFIIMTEREFK